MGCPCRSDDDDNMRCLAACDCNCERHLSVAQRGDSDDDDHDIPSTSQGRPFNKACHPPRGTLPRAMVAEGIVEGKGATFVATTIWDRSTSRGAIPAVILPRNHGEDRRHGGDDDGRSLSYDHGNHTGGNRDNDGGDAAAGGGATSGGATSGCSASHVSSSL